MALDLFGCLLSGRIRMYPGNAYDGQSVFELWTQSSDKPNPRAARELACLSYVTQVQIEVFMGRNSRIAMTMTPPLEAALAIINTPILQVGFGMLEVEVGYSTGNSSTDALMSPPYAGMLEKPSLSIGADVSVTLNAVGVGFMLDSTGNPTGIEYPAGTSPAEAVEKTLKKYDGLDLSELFYEDSKVKGTTAAQMKNSSEKSGFYHSLYGEPTKDKNGNVKKEAVKIVVSPKNDWWFIQDTCRNYGKDVFIVGQKVQIRDAGNWLASLPSGGARVFVIRGGLDPERGIFPILNLNSPTMSPFVLGQTMTQQQDVHADKSGTNAKQIDNTNEPYTQTKDGTFKVTPSGTKMNLAQPMPGNPSIDFVLAYARGDFRTKNYLKGVQIEVETVGIPGMIPGELIQISGTADPYQPDNAIYDGLYGVTKVIHNIGIGGYTTHFTAVGNFIPRFLPNTTSVYGDVPKLQPPPDKTGQSATSPKGKVNVPAKQDG